MKLKTLVVSLMIVVLALPLAASPRQRVLQVDLATLKQAATSGESDIAVCDYFHEIYPDYCTIWHVIAVIEITSTDPGEKSWVSSLQGAKLTLENARGKRENYRVDKVVPHYRLESGATFEPAAGWNPDNPVQERWTGVQTKRAPSRVVVDWRDVDGDGVVGARDSVIFDNGETAVINDVLVGVHVTRVR